MFALNKKIIFLLIFLTAIPVVAQDITIFFLKNGSIVQGEVLDENKRRVFLKTEEGILKIEPRDVIGRESHANEGDLTYLFEKVDYVRDHMEHLSGRMKLWSDSLDLNLENLLDMIHNLESIQYEYEIDFLRLKSKSKIQSKDIVNLKHKMDHSNKKQQKLQLILEHTVDSLNTLSDNYLILQKKVDLISNQNTILTGTVTNLIDDIRDIRRANLDNRNHIDILTGSLADLIRTMDLVQNKLNVQDSLFELSFSKIDNNMNNLINLTDKTELSQAELTISLEKQSVESITGFDKMNKKLSNNKQSFSKEISDLKSTIEKMGNRLSKLEKELTAP
ncbi:MAG: hypothetical protein ISR83_05210 [Candidatus Marinimicrobia bacterium]|nr:hypothetical protein [Candidatus Neomarinimicrobiota bacterium]